MVDSVVNRCPASGKCQNNINADYYCGFSFIRSDNFTYYFSCAKPAKGTENFPIQCQGMQCVQYATEQPAMITKCNLPGLLIQAGKCQGTNCPKNLKCESYYVGPQWKWKDMEYG